LRARLIPQKIKKKEYVMRNKIRRFSHVALGIVMLGSPMVGLAQNEYIDQGRKQAHPSNKTTLKSMEGRSKQPIQYYGAFQRGKHPPPTLKPTGERIIPNEPKNPGWDKIEDRSQHEWLGD
jgi:hypothetical protein